MSYPITAVVIPVEGQIHTETIESADTALEAFQCLVGGYIEPIDLPNGDSAFVDEEGKLKGYPENLRASAPLAGHLMPGDYISGTFVIVGQPNEDGETTSANVEAAKELFGSF